MEANGPTRRQFLAGLWATALNPAAPLEVAAQAIKEYSGGLVNFARIRQVFDLAISGNLLDPEEAFLAIEEEGQNIRQIFADNFTPDQLANNNLAIEKVLDDGTTLYWDNGVYNIDNYYTADPSRTVKIAFRPYQRGQFTIYQGLSNGNRVSGQVGSGISADIIKIGSSHSYNYDKPGQKPTKGPRKGYENTSSVTKTNNHKKENFDATKLFAFLKAEDLNQFTLERVARAFPDATKKGIRAVLNQQVKLGKIIRGNYTRGTSRHLYTVVDDQQRSRQNLELHRS